MRSTYCTSSKNATHRPFSVVFLSAVLSLLLGACSMLDSGHTTTTTSSASQQSSITTTLQEQGTSELQTFQQWITLTKHYGGNVSATRQQYMLDQHALQNARTAMSYRAALTTLNTHVDAIQIPAMRAEAQSLQQQLQLAVSRWGQLHTYYDAYNDTTYPLGYEYGENGIGSWVQNDLSTAQTIAEYQQAIENLNMYLFNFQAMMTNSSAKTAYNQPHATDLQLLRQNNDMTGKAVIVSLSEQAMRIYDHGRLVKAFLVTTGRPDRPSIPGVWWVEAKQSPTVFKAGVPESNPNWYPDTPINYAMQYHSNGYFLHDSWWRDDYGPGTNFPHADPSGDSYSSQGSHGCVNLSKANAGWLYNFVNLSTPVIIY